MIPQLTNTSLALEFARSVAAEAGMLHDMLNDQLQDIPLTGDNVRVKKAVSNLYGVASALSGLHDQAMLFAERLDELELKKG